jgi:hypothetical protein
MRIRESISGLILPRRKRKDWNAKGAKASKDAKELRKTPGDNGSEKRLKPRGTSSSEEIGGVHQVCQSYSYGPQFLGLISTSQIIMSGVIQAPRKFDRIVLRLIAAGRKFYSIWTGSIEDTT